MRHIGRTQPPHICQAGVSVTRSEQAAASNFLAGVSALLCEDAASTNLLAGVPATGCKDAATANFLAGVSGRPWQEIFREWPPQAPEILCQQGRHYREFSENV